MEATFLRRKSQGMSGYCTAVPRRYRGSGGAGGRLSAGGAGGGGARCLGAQLTGVRHLSSVRGESKEEGLTRKGATKAPLAPSMCMLRFQPLAVLSSARAGHVGDVVRRHTHMTASCAWTPGTCHPLKMQRNRRWQRIRGPDPTQAPGRRTLQQGVKGRHVLELSVVGAAKDDAHACGGHDGTRAGWGGAGRRQRRLRRERGSLTQRSQRHCASLRGLGLAARTARTLSPGTPPHRADKADKAVSWQVSLAPRPPPHHTDGVVVDQLAHLVGRGHQAALLAGHRALLHVKVAAELRGVA